MVVPLVAVAVAVVACRTSPSAVPTTEVPIARVDAGEAGESASVDAGVTASTDGIASSSERRGPSTCRAVECKGSPPPKLVEALASLAQKGHRCYDRALVTDPKLRGKVTILVRIDAQGRVCEADGHGTGAMGAVAECVAGLYRQAPDALPAPDGGCAHVNIPINFVPRDKDAGAAP
jgi:hypothetical protein